MDFYLEGSNGGGTGSGGFFKVEFQGFLQILERFVLSLPLTCNINLDTLGDESVAFLCDNCRELFRHDNVPLPGENEAASHQQMGGHSSFVAGAGTSLQSQQSTEESLKWHSE